MIVPGEPGAGLTVKETAAEVVTPHEFVILTQYIFAVPGLAIIVSVFVLYPDQGEVGGTGDPEPEVPFQYHW